jgi:hypothetical protein
MFGMQTPKADCLPVINMFYNGFLFRFDTSIDYATMYQRIQRYLPDTLYKEVLMTLCNPGTEFYALYGTNTIVVLSVVPYVPSVNMEASVEDNICTVNVTCEDCGDSPSYQIFLNGVLVSEESSYSFEVFDNDSIYASVTPSLSAFPDTLYTPVFVPPPRDVVYPLIIDERYTPTDDDLSLVPSDLFIEDEPEPPEEIPN